MINEDVHRLWSFIWSLSDSIQLPFRFIYAAYFLYLYMGLSVLSGIALFAITFTINFFIGKWRHARWLRQRSVRDKRNQETSEAFGNAKMLKLYGWKDLFLGRIAEKREEEQVFEDQNMVQDRIIGCVQHLLGFYLPISIYSTFIYTGHHLDLATKILTGHLIGQVRQPIDAIQHKMNETRDVMAALRRIHKVMASDEVQSTIISKVSTDSKYSVEIKGNFSWGVGEQVENRLLESWEKDQAEQLAKKNRKCKFLYAKAEELFKKIQDSRLFRASKKERKQQAESEKKKRNEIKKFEDSLTKKTKLSKYINLQGIDIKIEKGEFVTILGEIGCGKSTFLQTLIGDLVYVPDSEIATLGGIKTKHTPQEYA